MDSKTNIALSGVFEDIWADELQILGDSESIPQIPKITKQFTNTLKDNKGKANKEDLELMVHNTHQSGCVYEKVPSKTHHIRLDYKNKCRSLKPRTHDQPQNPFFKKHENEALRRIPSTEILKSILN
ncbi:unnamed protein product [Moneuplotes crassus]|uniref:Uncharacterized protein n=1 Tax=Euplotes crassus TaxID=5936 RepID=A0AAD1U741_EUPCR|nr:unnamed protein product [Moneuplotes crassus]